MQPVGSVNGVVIYKGKHAQSTYCECGLKLLTVFLFFLIKFLFITM